MNVLPLFFAGTSRRIGFYAIGKHQPESFLAEVEKLTSDRPVRNVAYWQREINGQVTPVTWLQLPDGLDN